MSNRVVVTLEGRDNLSGVLSRAAATGVAMGNAITSAFSLAGDALGGVFKGFQSAVDRASSTQLDLIGSAGALKDVMGGSFEDSMKFAKGLNTEFVKLGASLPGTAEDFAMIGRSVSDDVIRAFDTADGIDMDNAKSTLLGLTEGWTLLAQQSKTNSAEAGQLLTRLLGGDTSALRMVMFDRSPAFKSALNKVLESNGKSLKDWKSASTRERSQWLQEATKLTIPPEAISAMSNTLDGVTSEWKNALMDPTTGVFGMLRELPDFGGMTALDGLTQLFQSVDGLFKQLGDKFPFKVDVMSGLMSVFTNLNNMVQQATSFVGSFNMSNLGNIGQKLNDWIVNGIQQLVSGIQSLPPINLAGILSQFFQIQNALNNWFQNLVTNIVSSLGGGTSIDLSSVVSQVMQVLSQIGQVMAQQLNSLVQSVRDSISSINWSLLGSQVGVLLGQAVTQGLGAIMGVAVAIDWGPLIAGIWELRNAIISGVRGVLTGLGSVLLSNFLQGVGIINAAVMSQVQVLMANILTGITGIMAQIGIGIQSLMAAMSQIGSMLSTQFMVVMSQLQAGMATITASITSAIQSLIAGLTAIGASMTSQFMAMMAQVQAGLSQVTSSITMAIQSLIAGMAAMGVSMSAQFSVMMSSIQATMASIMSGITSTITSIGAGILGGLQAAAAMAISAAASLGGQIMAGVQSLVATIASAVNGALSSAGSAIKGAISGAVSGAVSSAKSSISSIIGGGKFRGQPRGLTAYSAYRGNVGVAAGGNGNLLSAIADENKNKPPGSNLVVANSSEAILTRRQQQRLKDQLNNKGLTIAAKNGGSNIQSSPTINIYTQGQVDIEQISNAIFDKIDQHIRTEYALIS